VEEKEKEQLLQQFSKYLDTIPAEDKPIARDDTFGLHAELAGLKNEVHIESRQLQQALDDFRAVFASLESANKQLDQQLADAREREDQTTREAVKPLLGSLIDLLDRFTEASAIKPPRKTFFTFRYAHRQKQWIKAQQKGMEMLMERFTDITTAHGLEKMDCTGKPFTVEYMQAVGTNYDPDQEEGTVLTEVRTGFLLHGEPMRFAEVIVNRNRQE